MTSAIKKTRIKEVDMLSGPVLPSLIKFAIPIFLTNLLQQLYSTADTLVVGAMGGKESLAAIGATASVINMLIVVFNNVFVGTNILVARARGNGDDTLMRKIVSTTYVMSIIFGVGLFSIGEFLSVPMLEITGCPEHIINDSAKYLRIYFLAMPAAMLMNCGASIIRSAGNSRSPFIYMSISGLMNVVCNVIFVLLFGDPVASVAWATVLSHYVAAILFIIHMIRDKSATGLNPFNFSFCGDIFAKTIKYGIPASISSMTFSITNFIIQPTINSYGDVGISGIAAAGAINAYIFTITGALSAAATTFIGQNVGANQRPRVKEAIIKSYALGIVAISIYSIFIFIFGKTLLGFFIPGETEAIDFGYLHLQLITAASIFYAVMSVSSAIIQAYGYAMLQMISNVTGVCVLRLIWMWLIYPLNRTPLNFLICYPISYALTAIELVIVAIILTKKYLGGKDFRL